VTTAARSPVLVLERRAVAALLDLEACIDAVERAFRQRGTGRASAPGTLSFHAPRGTFHVKSGMLDLDRSVLVVKANANFPANPNELGLPTIQGVIVLLDAHDGQPLAVLDSIEITRLRTAAATAVAAKRLARPESEVATICGCGEQGRVQLQALRSVLSIRKVFAYDRDGCRSDRLADDLEQPGFEILPVADLAGAVAESDVCVTCTTSREFLLGRADVRPGTFIAAVGADNPEKREIHPDLMSACTVVVDDLEQCAAIGDLHHAIAAGRMTREQVHADLAAVVAGTRPGRTREDEITLFDSTGVALEDAAAAALVYERARDEDRCLSVRLGE